MSKFFSEKYSSLEPYVPGEQPRDMQYIKLNTNESPFPPSPKAIEYASREAERLMLYSDPESKVLTERIAAMCGVEPCNVLATNGSDEILEFAFMAFCDDKTPAVFPDITYGFYPVFAKLCGTQYREIPLRDDFTIDIADYRSCGGTVFIANPNAPTGIALTTAQIEEIIASNPDNVVVIDEAYVDFGGESCVPLTKKYDNLLVTQTFSKSRSMAGARLGFGVGCAALIRDLNTIKYSTNPYNVNRMTGAAGIGSLEDEQYTRRNCEIIVQNRQYASEKMRALGFEMTDSAANFIFARHPEIDGGEIYRALRERGILVRHFGKERISQYNRITVGTREQMDALLAALCEITGGSI
ncbi:MAG: histidinol-phosphate transaminase [Clostridia bacterium]|nr:histidinol-phosphate transaminase [Clostridia bacterium]